MKIIKATIEKNNFKPLIWIFVVLSLCSQNHAFASDYQVTFLDPRGLHNFATSISNGQQVGYGADSGFADFHAMLWSNSASGFVDLNPVGFHISCAYGANGSQQVGYGIGSATDGEIHALLWNSSPDSYTDLHPAGFSDSFGRGVSGSQQVGYGSAADGNYHALLWDGSAESFVDLNPAGFDTSRAYGTNGTQQVGYGAGFATDGNNHALLWNGSAESCIDLNPVGFSNSYARSISGTQQVGYGVSSIDDKKHALFWNDSAESFVDLHPAGFNDSYAYGTSGTQQVGYGTQNGRAHALLWNGSADSYIDLNQFLPYSSDMVSRAMAIDDYGNIVGYCRFDFTTYSGYMTQATNITIESYISPVLWQPVPEPASVFLFGLGSFALLRKRR